jgi:hypothetical protein
LILPKGGFPQFLQYLLLAVFSVPQC